jgi:hypothetical protein
MAFNSRTVLRRRAYRQGSIPGGCIETAAGEMEEPGRRWIVSDLEHGALFLTVVDAAGFAIILLEAEEGCRSERSTC